MIFRQSAITNLGIAINPLQPEEAPLNRASHRCFRVFQLPFYVHAFSTVIFRQSAITNLGIAINPLQPEEAPLNRASHRCFRVFQLPFYVHAFDERLTKFASKVLDCDFSPTRDNEPWHSNKSSSARGSTTQSSIAPMLSRVPIAFLRSRIRRALDQVRLQSSD